MLSLSQLQAAAAGMGTAVPILFSAPHTHANRSARHQATAEGTRHLIMATFTESFTTRHDTIA